MRAQQHEATFAPLVSIITPTFNHERFIGPCISSVLAQTYRNWEQIILDDGSTDETAAIVRSYTDPRIRYQRQEHVGILGLAQTYNRALRAARGELISILEGDDLWTADKLDRLVPALADPDVVLGYGRTEILVGNEPTGKLIPDGSFERNFGRSVLFNDPPGAATFPLLIRSGFGFPCAVLIRRSALEAIGGFQYVKDFGAVDYPTLLALTLQGRFDYVESVVAYWRRHSASASWAGQERNARAAYEFVQAFIRDRGTELTLRADQIRQIEQTWRHYQQRVAFNAGRSLLLQGRWAEARNRFVQAVRSPSPAVIAGAVVGYVASWLRTDIERLLTAAGRVSFGTSGRPQQEMAVSKAPRGLDGGQATGSPPADAAERTAGAKREANR
jgi:glycosyltransferase involved in cell wall biosynthesis